MAILPYLLSMKWTVLYDKKIEKQVLKLRPSTKKAFAQAILDLKREGPFPKGWNVKPLQGEDSIRLVLDYRHRLIYQSFEGVLKITILKVSTREGAYR